MLLERIDPLDRVLEKHAVELGRDLTAYRNHTYRVLNLCVALAPCADAALEKVALAAAFHDLGIWSARTFDYLQPSIELALEKRFLIRGAELNDFAAVFPVRPRSRFHGG